MNIKKNSIFLSSIEWEDFLFVKYFPVVSNNDDMKCVEDKDNPNFDLAIYDLNRTSEFWN